MKETSGKTERLSNGSVNEVRERREARREGLRGLSINRDSGDWKPELNSTPPSTFF